VARSTVAVGVLGLLVAQGSASTPTNFAVMSPGWVLNSVYNAISMVASAPITSIAQAADSSLFGLSINQSSSNDSLSCADYEAQLLRNYQSDFSSVGDKAAGDIPMAMDAMWEQTGLRAYIDVQFGQQSLASSAGQLGTNDYGLRVFCRYLESRIGVSPQNQLAITTAGASGDIPSANTQSAAWLTPGSGNGIVDASIIAWAACEYSNHSWHVDPEFTTLGGGHQVQAVPNCQNWWQQSASDWGEGPFYWSTDPNAITSYAANSPAVANFLYNWHGDANGTAMVTAIIFVPAAIAVFCVYLLLAGAVMLAKMALLVLIILIPIALVLSLLPGRRWEGSISKLSRYFLGMIIFVTVAQFVLTLAALIAGFLTQAGAGLFGAGSVLTILWTAFTPIAAIILLHHTFKAIGAPSPFKLNSSLGWAAAAGGVGFGVGEALHNRTAGRASQGLRLVGRRAGRSATRFVSQPSKRTGGLIPTDRNMVKQDVQANSPARGSSQSAQSKLAGVAGQDKNSFGKGKATPPGGGVAGSAFPASIHPREQDAEDIETPKAQEVPPRPWTASDELVRRREERSAVMRHYRETLKGEPPPEDAKFRQRAMYRLRSSRAYVPMAAIADRLKEPRARFREKPVRSVLKYGGIAAAAVLASPLPVLTTGAVVGGVAAARVLRRAHLEHAERKEYNWRQRYAAWKEWQDAHPPEEEPPANDEPPPPRIKGDKHTSHGDSAGPPPTPSGGAPQPSPTGGGAPQHSRSSQTSDRGSYERTSPKQRPNPANQVWSGQDELTPTEPVEMPAPPADVAEAPAPPADVAETATTEVKATQPTSTVPRQQRQQTVEPSEGRHSGLRSSIGALRARSNSAQVRKATRYAVKVGTVVGAASIVSPVAGAAVLGAAVGSAMSRRRLPKNLVARWSEATDRTRLEPGRSGSVWAQFLDRQQGPTT